eukprot:747940-Hanusia_phi.AAC.4
MAWNATRDGGRGRGGGGAGGGGAGSAVRERDDYGQRSNTRNRTSSGYDDGRTEGTNQLSLEMRKMVQNAIRGRLFGVSDHLRKLARGSSRDGGVGLVIQCWKALFHVVYDHLCHGQSMYVNGLGTFTPCLQSTDDVALDLESSFLTKSQVSYRKEVKKVPQAAAAHPLSYTEVAIKCEIKREFAADILVGLLESVKEEISRGDLSGLDMLPVGILLIENRQVRFLSAKLRMQEQPAQEAHKEVRREAGRKQEEREPRAIGMSSLERSKMDQETFLIQRMKDSISRQFSSSDDVFAFFTNDNSTITVEQLIHGIRKIVDVSDEDLASLRKQVLKQHGTVLQKSDFERMLCLDKLSQKELLCFKCIYDAVYIAKSTLKEVFQLADKDNDGKVRRRRRRRAVFSGGWGIGNKSHRRVELLDARIGEQ